MFGAFLPRAGSADDTLDLSKAYVELRPWSEWRLRAGRQELAFGDERLIGSDAEWSYLGMSFDALRLSGEFGPAELDWFVSRPVAHLDGEWNHSSAGVGLHGIYATLDLGARNRFDSYALLKHERGAESELGHVGTGNRFTMGFRHTADLPARLETNVEFAAQRGSAAGDRLRAWAGHWEVGRPIRDGDNAVEIHVQYNQASGHRMAGDGIQNQFDDLFPAGHDAFGMLDPFPWSNQRSVGISADQTFDERWDVCAGMRSLWYSATAEEASHMGSQFSILSSYQASENWTFHAGYSYLAVSASLREMRYPTHGPFLALRFHK